MAYWITFQDSKAKPVCIELKFGGGGEQMARKLAEEHSGAPVEKVWMLPYPASPCIVNQTGCPTFCLDGDQCKGRSSCPRDYACSE